MLAVIRRFRLHHEVTPSALRECARTPASRQKRIADSQNANFDGLDFRVHTRQRCLDLHRNHAANVVVHYPDGHITEGIPDRIKESKYIWKSAPDNRITERSVRFDAADGHWTTVMGCLDGTFTKPMVLADGKVRQPTGKRCRLPMATLGHWNSRRTMDGDTFSGIQQL